MLRFFDLERIEATKRDVMARIKDFKEIYEIFQPEKASEQADRCIQCGDPYCHNGCPLHNFIPQWLRAVASRDLEFAFRLSNQSSPFPEVMGRICPHDRLCEGNCTLNDGYGAITIGSIETYISEEGFKRGYKPKFATKKSGKKVAIVGAGPAGLSAATFLLREGIDVELFDRQNRPGGLLTYGIPGFKLDKSVVERRVEILKEAGAIFHQNREVGRDISFEELLEKFDAVFVGVGATKGRRAGIDGEDAKGSFLAMEYLVNVQKRLFEEEVDEVISAEGKDVVVIGGGDTAMDCVRTALREKAKSVKCLYRRGESNMPGSKKEYLNAKEEGVEFEFFASPKRILKDEDGKVVGIEMIKTELTEADSSGRKRVVEIEGSEFTLEADMVIFALGFDNVKYEFLEKNGIELDKWGAVKIDENGKTSNPKVWAGGDCQRGADLVVTAVNDGKIAAISMAKELLEVE
jgi:glutamate synthase (NADPH/NADH) small chain